MIKRFHQIDKGLYRGSAPTIEDVIYLNKKYGIKKIVSLDYSAGKHIDRACHLLGIEHVMLPLDVFRKSTFIKLLHHNLKDLLMKNGPVFIHCVEGKDRTGVVAAMYRCRYQGWSYEDALKEAKGLGLGKHLKSKTTQYLIEFLKHYCNHQEKQDTNDAYDIVSNTKDLQGEYRDYTLDGMEQQSWSPYEDYRIKRYPDSDTHRYYDEQYDTRNDQDGFDILDMEISDNTIPTSGTYDQNTQGINGAGPSLVGSGFV